MYVFVQNVNYVRFLQCCCNLRMLSCFCIVGLIVHVFAFVGCVMWCICLVLWFIMCLLLLFRFWPMSELAIKSHFRVHFRVQRQVCRCYIFVCLLLCFRWCWLAVCDIVFTRKYFCFCEWYICILYTCWLICSNYFLIRYQVDFPFLRCAHNWPL